MSFRIRRICDGGSGASCEGGDDFHGAGDVTNCVLLVGIATEKQQNVKDERERERERTDGGVGRWRAVVIPEMVAAEVVVR
jgi:hypothetical protein